MRLKVSRVLVTAGLLAAAMLQGAAAQQHNITIDRSFGSPTTLIGPNYEITANLGKQVGSNLFQSFGKFGLTSSESATFSGPAAVSNVIGRVTGGALSNIDGKIASTITGASLYLINPSGIVFGPNATVNVSGGFRASTADYLRMSDGAKFQATNPGSSTLSAAPPAAFGFLTAQPAKITVNGTSLGVPSRQTLGLVGGPVSIKGGTLSAPAGTIHVTSAAGTGEVPVDPRNTAALTVTSFGPVKIKGGSTLDVSNADALGGGGSVFIRSGALTIDASEVNGDNYGSGPGGQLALQADSRITLTNTANVHALAQKSGTGGDIVIRTSPGGRISVDDSLVAVGSLAAGDSGQLSISTGELSLVNGAALRSDAQGSGGGGPITISAGSVVLDGGATLDQSTGIFSTTSDVGPGGSITIVAGNLALHNGANVLASSCATAACSTNPDSPGTVGAGPGGGIAVSVDGRLTIDSGASLGTIAEATGAAGDVSVFAAGPVTIDMAVGFENSTLGGIGSLTTGAGNAGNVNVAAGTIALTNSGLISSQTVGVGNNGNAGEVSVGAGTLSIASNGVIAASTFASGNAGSVTIAVSGQLTIDGSGGDPRFGTGIFSEANSGSTGAAGTVSVGAANLIIRDNGEIAASTFAAGNAGSVTVAVSGQLTIDGSSGSPGVSTGIFSQANPQSSGAAGTVSVSAGNLSIVDSGEIATSTFVPGDAGIVTVTVSGQLTIDGSRERPREATGIFSQTNSANSGAAGTVRVSAGTLVIAKGGVISSTTFGSGNAATVTVTVDGQLTIDGSGAGAGIFSQADPGSRGAAGSVGVSAGTLVIANNGVISSETFGFGNGGNVLITARNLAITSDGSISTDTSGRGSGNAGGISVTVADRLTLDGVFQTSFTGVSSKSEVGSDGNAGDIKVISGQLSIGNGGAISTTTGGSGAGGTIAVAVAGEIALSGGGLITSATSGAGNAGTVEVVAQRPLSLTALGTGIVASATSTASGNAGSVIVAAPQLTITTGAEIASTTAGTGAGGSVIVTTPGILALDGAGVANTQIAASAIGPQSGSGGSVTVAANSLTIERGARIASSTAGPGTGGNVNVTVATDIVLPDPGPQITARSTGSGDAGSITVSAVRLLMNNGASISTEAETSTANGGNITLHLRDFLHLVSSEISTSVKGETGNGGNIVIDPQLVILNHSSIIAQAIEGHGGNITITADQFIPSSDSIISATSELGISGTLVINGPRVDVNGALVVLSSQLRGRTEVLREACAARADRPISSLVEAGRGGLPQDPEATLPALYIAGRDVNSNLQRRSDSTEASPVLPITVHLTMHCG